MEPGAPRTDITPDGGRKFTVDKEPANIPPSRPDLIERYDKARDAYVKARNGITEERFPQEKVRAKLYKKAGDTFATAKRQIKDALIPEPEAESVKPT